MAQVVVKVEGLNEALSKIRGLSFAAQQAVREQVGESALNIQRGAKARCPVDTGALRNSITVDFYQAGMTAEIAPHMPYAGYVEFGTGQRGSETNTQPGTSYDMHLLGTRAQPYMVPAFEEERSRYEEGIRQAVRRSIR